MPASWMPGHGGPEAIVDREQGLKAALGAGDHGNVKVPKKRRGRKPKAKAKAEPDREDPDDGFPDWMGAG